jgi:hypothetical protein
VVADSSDASGIFSLSINVSPFCVPATDTDVVVAGTLMSFSITSSPLSAPKVDDFFFDLPPKIRYQRFMS